jgi:hypothetical protein
LQFHDTNGFFLRLYYRVQTGNNADLAHAQLLHLKNEVGQAQNIDQKLFSATGVRLELMPWGSCPGKLYQMPPVRVRNFLFSLFVFDHFAPQKEGRQPPGLRILQHQILLLLQGSPKAPDQKIPLFAKWLEKPNIEHG